MYTIGFAEKFYTLWDVTTENFVSANGRKATRTDCRYIKNISYDKETALAKYPDAELDETLRGHSSFSRVEYEPLPTDVFPCGRWVNTPIADCPDLDYLYWAEEHMLDEDRREIAKTALLKSGKYQMRGETLLSNEEVKEIEEWTAEAEALVAQLEMGEKITIQNTSNIHYGDYYYSETAVDGVTLIWNEDRLKEMYYSGYEYYLPIDNSGKGKKIKNKALIITPESFEVDRWAKGIRMNIKVKDFEIKK